MAEVYLKSVFPCWRVGSAGTRALDGAPATALAQTVAREFGLDLSRHRARSLCSVAGEEFDRVWVMGREHLLEAPPQAKLLSSLQGESRSVRDPYGGTLADYLAAFEEIRRYLDALGSGEDDS